MEHEAEQNETSSAGVLDQSRWTAFLHQSSLTSVLPFEEEFSDAATCMDASATLVQLPAPKPAHLLLAVLLIKKAGRQGLARRLLGDLITQHPLYVEAVLNLVDMLFAQRRYTDALTLTQWSHRSLPHHHELVSLGVKAAQFLGDFAALRQFHEYAPSEYTAYHQLWSQVYHVDTTLQHIREHATNLFDEYRPRRERLRTPKARKERPIVALVGTYLHPMFLTPLLASVDRNRIEIHLYTNDARGTQVWDGQTFSMDTKTPSNIAQNIAENDTDVLIEMTGSYFGIELMKERPARRHGFWIAQEFSKQASFCDFVFTDQHLIPSALRSQWSEEILEVPIWAPFEFYGLPERKETSPLPRDWDHTFGVCQRVLKINDTMLKAWSSIVNSVPNSGIIMKDRSFGCPTFRHHFSQRLTSHGFDPTSFILEADSPHPEYFDYHRRIDVSLDTFPYGGGITTAECLGMGVPVVTLAGDLAASRLAASYVLALGYPEWTATTVENYCEIAAGLVQDSAALNTFKRHHRAMIAESTLQNHRAFAESFEQHIVAL